MAPSFLCFGVLFQCVSVFLLPSSVAAVTFELPERTFSMVVEEDGSALVEETVTWLLKDPFRYVTWRVEYPSEVDIEDLQVAVLQGPNLTPEINYVMNRHMWSLWNCGSHQEVLVLVGRACM